MASTIGQTVSTNDILSAMVLKEMISRQQNFLSENIELTFPVDVRNQIKEYGAKFFGNALLFHTAEFRVKDIEKWDIDEIDLAIRKTMPEVNKERYLDYLTCLESLIEDKKADLLYPYDPQKGCLVTNLSRMPVHKLDFGAGKPDLAFLLTTGRNSAAILSDKKNFIIRMSA